MLGNPSRWSGLIYSAGGLGIPRRTGRLRRRLKEPERDSQIGWSRTMGFATYAPDDRSSGHQIGRSVQQDVGSRNRTPV